MINFGASAAAVGGVAGGGLDLGAINGTMNNLLTSTETSLSTLMSTIGAEASPSITDMLSLQQGLQNWSVSVESTSTITKDFFDSLKEVLQKA
jgi:hypothetical protein